MNNIIPKTINYCWFGNNEKPLIVKKCIESWKKYCPDYKIIEWNEKNFDININNYVKEAYRQKKYAFVSDFARLWIIYENGGIYLDTDVELIRNIDDILENKTFFATEDNIYVNTGLGFGSQKNSEILKKLIDDYSDINFIGENGKMDKTTCPVRNTKVIEKYINTKVDFDKKTVINDICFYSKEFFCPLDYETKKMEITNNTFAIHWFSGTWMNKKEKMLKQIKLILKNIIKK